MSEDKLSNERCEILERAALRYATKHDERSFTVLYAAAKTRIEAFVVSRGFRGQDVDDIVSVTGMALWIDRAKFSGNYQKFVSLGVAIAGHRVARWRKKQAQWKRTFVVSTAFTPLSGGPEDAASNVNPEDLIAIKEALNSLSEREAFIVLGRGEGRTLDEIAEEIGLSVSTVWAIYNAAMKKVQRAR